jgi:sugar phosphate isomerase/epimerase
VQVDRDGRLHLTYCTNIHAADGWAAVSENIRRYAPALKARLSPTRPFGIGLRLSARDARELLDGQLDAFRAWLDQEGLYVAVINGFPFGTFHRAVVKADVYAPDWRDETRVAYTLDLVAILSRLLPAGLDGGVSTAPLSYKAWMPAADTHGWDTVTVNVARVADVLYRLRRDRGMVIHLDIEPEPDCSIETSEETVAFFERWLLPVGGAYLMRSLGLNEAEAHAALREHIRVCFDCCHAAVEYEDPIAAIARLQQAGLQIGRIQLSSALRVTMPRGDGALTEITGRLRPFADSTYLHQTIARRGEHLEHFPDLADALTACHGDCGSEWRIHFHVPLFTRTYDGLESTQDDVRTVLRAVRHSHITTHLEIETYTWDVLPASLKIDLLDSIGREYEWVLRGLG